MLLYTNNIGEATNVYDQFCLILAYIYKEELFVSEKGH